MKLIANSGGDIGVFSTSFAIREDIEASAVGNSMSCFNGATLEPDQSPQPTSCLICFALAAPTATRPTT